MSRIFGEVRQNEYVVPNFAAAMDHWSRVLGVALMEVSEISGAKQQFFEQVALRDAQRDGRDPAQRC